MKQICSRGGPAGVGYEAILFVRKVLGAGMQQICSWGWRQHHPTLHPPRLHHPILLHHPASPPTLHAPHAHEGYESHDGCGAVSWCWICVREVLGG